jgi:hypothetical protein
MAAKRKKKTVHLKFGEAIEIEDLKTLASRLHMARLSGPVVQRRPGTREGDILGFVKGLRLSAQLVYFIRKRMSHTELEVSWGHLLDKNRASCSPECDIILHKKGYVDKWNGSDHPIMDFRFVHASEARAVVSCKSELGRIDAKYPAGLKKYGIKKVLLFAECCPFRRFDTLRKQAKAAGYAGLWCLYLTKADKTQIQIDDKIHVSFVKVLKSIAA